MAYYGNRDLQAKEWSAYTGQEGFYIVLRLQGVFVELDKADFDKTLAVGEFTDDGELVAHKSNLSEEHAAIAAKMCAANNTMARMRCNKYTAFSGMCYGQYGGLCKK